TAEQLLAHPQRRGLFIAGTMAALVAGGALAMILARPGHVATTTVGGGGALPTTAPPPVVTPVVTPLEPTPPPATGQAVLPTPTRDQLPPRHVARPHAKVNKVPTVVPKQSVHIAHTPEQVQAKFRTVRSEYAAFKSQYGPVLEDKWNAIASEITFGKADKM